MLVGLHSLWSDHETHAKRKDWRREGPFYRSFPQHCARVRRPLLLPQLSGAFPPVVSSVPEDKTVPR